MVGGKLQELVPLYITFLLCASDSAVFGDKQLPFKTTEMGKYLQQNDMKPKCYISGMKAVEKQFLWEIEL